VQRDGSKRLLGAYDEAGWSPFGRFVAATRGRELVTLEPNGDPHWTRPSAAPVSSPVWSPAPGFRIAYLSGDDLRVAVGDNTGDRLLARDVAPVAPAWRPVGVHVLAFSDPDGRIVVAEADSRRTLWRSAAGPPPSQLAWSPDGRQLVALSERSLRVFGGIGRPMASVTLPAGVRAGALAVHPSGRTAALVRTNPSRRRSEVVSLSLDTGRVERRLFTGDGRFSDLAWSPDGRWLLIGWPDADQWLFIRSAKVRKVVAVSNIARQFDPAATSASQFPRVSGWCCPTAP
jgi:WD40 repeat protein